MFSVGNGVLWGEAEVGMVATQAIVDVSYGPQGLTLLKAHEIARVGPVTPALLTDTFDRLREHARVLDSSETA